MKDVVTLSALLILIAISSCAIGETDKNQPDASGEMEWQPLFDGETFSGWTGNQGGPIGSSWRVVGGNIVVSGGRTGDLVSVATFENFELKLEWKIAAKGNSGVFFRVSNEPGSIWMSGIEYQLLDDPGYPDWVGTDQAAGAVFGLFAPHQTGTMRAGEYNSSRIQVWKNSVSYWLNGVLVARFRIGSDLWKRRVAASKFAGYPQFASLSKGHIALQDHGDEVWFRDIRIKPLIQPPDTFD